MFDHVSPSFRAFIVERHYICLFLIPEAKNEEKNTQIYEVRKKVSFLSTREEQSHNRSTQVFLSRLTIYRVYISHIF